MVFHTGTGETSCSQNHPLKLLARSDCTVFFICEASISVLHNLSHLFSRLLLRESGCQSHRTPVHVELVFRLGIEVGLYRVATVYSCIHSNFPLSSSPSLQTAFWYLLGSINRELYLTVHRNELSSVAFLGRPASLIACSLQQSGDTPSFENIKPW